MGEEPGYITDLKKQLGGVQKGVSGTEKAIVRIDTTLAQTLPEMKDDLKALNGSVRQHDTSIALHKQAQDDCPARKAVESGTLSGGTARGWIIDLNENRTKAGVGGVIVGVPAAIFLLLEIARLAAEHIWGM